MYMLWYVATITDLAAMSSANLVLIYVTNIM